MIPATGGNGGATRAIFCPRGHRARSNGEPGKGHCLYCGCFDLADSRAPIVVCQVCQGVGRVEPHLEPTLAVSDTRHTGLLGGLAPAPGVELCRACGGSGRQGGA